MEQAQIAYYRCLLYTSSEVYMNYSIRELKRDENKILDTFLYEAIFISEGVPVPVSYTHLEQQEGRILRQGNKNKKVKIFR